MQDLLRCGKQELLHGILKQWQHSAHVARNNATVTSPSCSLFAARNTPAVRHFLRSWANMLLDPHREVADTPGYRGFAVTDQVDLRVMKFLSEPGAAGRPAAVHWPLGDRLTLLARSET